MPCRAPFHTDARASTLRSIDALERGRESYARRAWTDARESLSRADGASPLRPDDLELLATSAYMLGRDDEHLAALERAHHAYLEAGEALRAVRCAFWSGINLVLRGEVARATGWLGRAQRLLEQEDGECVERGYLLLPAALQQGGAGELEAAASIAGDAAEIGQRFGDRDLFALAVHEQGHMLVRHGDIERGLGLLDEAMVGVTAGELSPIVTGIVYCGVIESCRDAYELRRAREWTDALTSWCERQPDLVAFSGRCLVHRAEVMELHGTWRDALEEARRARQRCLASGNERAAAEASYRRAEVHRLRGEPREAEEAYRDASRGGFEPQPGLALLRLAQGDTDAAAASIRRVAGETREPLRRAGLLPACVEIMLAAGDLEEAARASRELDSTAEGHEDGMLGAMAAQARGAVALAAGDAGSALAGLRHAAHVWQELGAPYEVARARVLVAQACRELGDGDAAALELEAARGAFSDLGAAPELERLDSLTGTRDGGHGGLTPRELEVLRLMAAGETNKAIAEELVLSERTVDRHVSNILAKLRVRSRAAATAYAYEHELIRAHGMGEITHAAQTPKLGGSADDPPRRRP